MHVVVLPASSVPDRRLKPLLVGLERLAQAGEFIELYAYVPDGSLDGQSEIIRFLLEAANTTGCVSILIIPVHALSSGILEHPYLNVIQRLVIDFGAEIGAESQKLKALGAYVEANQKSGQQITAWVSGSLSALKREVSSGLRRISEVVPEIARQSFFRGRERVSVSPGARRVVEGSPYSFPGCHFFASTLTIDSEGSALCCPVHDGSDSKAMELGNVDTDSVESLLIRKGQVESSLGKSAVCEVCRLPARMTWTDSRGEYVRELGAVGASGLEAVEHGSLDWTLALQQDLALTGDLDFERLLGELKTRLEKWAAETACNQVSESGGPAVSIETPVIKAGWLLPCIESVLVQSSDRWEFSLIWDGGDDRSKQILEVVHRFDHPRLRVYFGGGLGVARARRYLTERSNCAYILPLDDDDLLKPVAIEQLLGTVEDRPWSGIVRARRDFVDEFGIPVEMDDWFPFGPRDYDRGATRDLFNHSQPYLISRAAYEETDGWQGFPEYRFAGEDCDIFVRIEEIADIEFLDEVLYSYRLSGSRTSHELGSASAQDMWKRIALATVERRGLPLSLTNDTQPYSYSRNVDRIALGQVGFVFLTDRAEEGVADRLEKQVEALELPGNLCAVLNAETATTRDYRETVDRLRVQAVCLIQGIPSDGILDVVELLLDELNSQDADLIGPKIVDKDGSALAGEPCFDSRMLPDREGSSNGNDPIAGSTSVPWLPSELLIVRSYVIRTIGGFDRSMTGNVRDADFCLRARIRGFRCIYAAGIASARSQNRTQEVRSENVRRFLDRWGRTPELLFPEETAV